MLQCGPVPPLIAKLGHSTLYRRTIPHAAAACRAVAGFGRPCYDYLAAGATLGPDSGLLRKRAGSHQPASCEMGTPKMVDTIGYLAGFLAMISFFPQVIKTLRTRRTDDISMGMLLLTLITNILYIIYGSYLELYPIIIMIGIMTCVVILQITLTLIWSSRNKGRPGVR